jgi:hypothetical protein
MFKSFNTRTLIDWIYGVFSPLHRRARATDSFQRNEVSLAMAATAFAASGNVAPLMTRTNWSTDGN